MSILCTSITNWDGEISRLSPPPRHLDLPSGLEISYPYIYLGFMLSKKPTESWKKPPIYVALGISTSKDVELLHLREAGYGGEGGWQCCKSLIQTFAGIWF
ncbi:hypothetical protein KSP39_PZI003614 [Platanthera zijinensis]|uniref:Uncharacterized protein n=1 Tax=Platanthera zijinensis TaxID=2320716 RepID=A0AAP0BY26_9ASPA